MTSTQEKISKTRPKKKPLPIKEKHDTFYYIKKQEILFLGKKPQMSEKMRGLQVEKPSSKKLNKLLKITQQ